MASTMLGTRRASPITGQPTSHLRRDIQGLRALAVLAVIADHLAGYPSGGFLGVDIFFVISGFIITSLLLRQHEQNGRLSFADFYRRRVKRILPVSTLVLVVTVGISFLIFRAGRAHAILSDGLWSFFFAGNWRFAITGTDYWAADGTISPLQHYWSLGVEEQYYFVWPLVIALTLTLAARVGLNKVSSEFVLMAVLAIAVLASFFWAVNETSRDASWAYFSTASRAWELGMGALIAVSSKALRRLPNIVRPVLAWVGLVGILVSIFTMTPESEVPAPGVAWAVVATALVIAAGTGGERRFLLPLTNPVSGYLGDISFSLYLWHFPVIILGKALFDAEGPAFFIMAILATVVLSVLSYTFVEDPIRRSAWLEPNRKPRAGSGNQKYIGLAALLVVTFIVCFVALLPRGVPAGGSVAVSAPLTPPPSASATAEAEDTNQARLTAAIGEALGRTSWPELTPSIDNVMSEGGPIEDQDGCSEVIISDLASCNFPQQGATKSAVVFGDSTGITLLPTVRQALGENYSVRGLTMPACVPLDVEVNTDDSEKKSACEQHKAEAVSAINETRPDIVFVSTMYGYVSDLASKTPFYLAGAEWQAGAESLVKKIGPSGAQVIFVQSPPLGKALSDCATRVSTPADCAVTLPKEFVAVAEYTSKAATATGAAFMDSRLWFCSPDERCPSFVGTTPVKRDAIHTTRQYASVLVPTFQDRLVTLTGGL